MRSVYAKIALWSFATLILSLLAFVSISRYLATRTMGQGPMDKINVLQLEEAREAYEMGGAPALQRYLARLNRIMGADHHLTNAVGKDLVTGDTRPGPAHWTRDPRDGRVAINRVSPDGRYRFVVMLPPAFSLMTFVPYYLLILAVVGLLCWLLAVNIASPLRQLALAVDRFGRGDLSVRIGTRRRDELGKLGRSFDTMADRIQTLLTAERQLLQDVSHELRSPLARLSFAAELVRTAQDREAAVARLRREIDRLTELVSALLQMTRAEGDPAQRKAEDLSLTDIVREISHDCELEASARGCRIEFAAAELATNGDRELIRRAVENIVRNAIRYAPAGSAVEIKLDHQGEYGVLSVRDYGPGVPEELLPKIFSPFFRVDGSRDSNTGGVGLGLAIAQRAVQLHQGELTAVNAKPGLRVALKLASVAPALANA